MKNKKCNILICGILSSGSSAVVDLLLEYNNTNVIPGEFDDFRAPGLVADQLSYHQSLDFPNQIETLIKNKNIIKLLYNIFPFFKWERHTITWIRSRYIFSSIRIRQLYYLKRLNRKLKLNIPYQDKIRFANNWITDIGNINVKNRTFIVFNQPIETSIDENIWNAVFNPYKLICVYRDPKDQLADIIKRGFLSATYDGPIMTIAGVNIEAIYGRNKEGTIKFHIDAIKSRMKWIDTMKNKLGPDNFLLIDFEGLINKYDDYKIHIENFIGGIKGHHAYKNKYFNPLKSKNNIGIYKNILSEDELGLLSELDSWYKNTIIQNNVQKDIQKSPNNLSRKHNIKSS